MSYHLKTPDHHIDKKLHISHLFQYVSAWAYSEELKEQLIHDLRAALRRVNKTCKPEIVSLDGEMFFVIHANWTFSLCLEWKHFEFCEVSK